MPVINVNQIKEKIYVVRGVKVMLDYGLAELYGYTTKTFNQQVKRNASKFKESHMFQLTKEELKTILRSQFATASWGGNRTLPNAFTIEGINLLPSILKGIDIVNVTSVINEAFKVFDLKRNLAELSNNGSKEPLKDMIHIIRGQKVMLDYDLADIYMDMTLFVLMNR